MALRVQHLVRWSPQDWRTCRVRGRSAVTADPMLRIVYLEILFALYESGGALSPDPEVLADVLMLPPAEISRCLPTLLQIGKEGRGGLYIEDGDLRNRRVTEDIEEELEYRRSAKEHGQKGGRPPFPKEREPQGHPKGTLSDPKGTPRAPARPHAPPPPPAPTPTPSPEEEKKFAPRPLVSAPPESPSDPLLFEFPCDGEERVWHLRAAKVAEWQESYPALDVLAQCRQALQYIRDNPAKRKTARGMPAFLGRWLARSQNSNGNGGSNGAPRRPTRNGDRPPDPERLAKLRERDRLARWDPDAVDQPEPSPPGAETPAEVLWSKAREKLKSSMDREEYFTWVAPIVPVPGDRPVVWCPSGRAAATVQEIYGVAIQEAAGGPVEVIHG